MLKLNKTKDLKLNSMTNDLGMIALNVEFRIFVLIFSSAPAEKQQQIFDFRHVQIDEIPRS